MEKKQSHFLIIYLLVLLAINVEFNEEISKRHFVLVHGPGHGAWCWYKITALLQSNGHNVTALDLAASGINPIQIRDVKFSSVLDYAQPLIDFMTSLERKERVILVGHSLGGLGISVATERFPKKIIAAVFVTALMPGPNLTYVTISEENTKRLRSVMDSQFIYDQGPKYPPTALKSGLISWHQRCTSFSPPEDLVLALSLLRPFPLFNNEELVLNQTKLTEAKYGLVRSVFIVSDQDLTIHEDVQRWMIEQNPPNEVKVINGTDHKVMFTRPLMLFSYLAEKCY